MNKVRRKAISEIADQIEALKADIESLQEEEDECRDNMIEGTEMYDISEEASSNMESAVSSLEEALDYLSSAAE